MDFLIMIVAAVIVFGKLAAKSEGEGKKKETPRHRRKSAVGGVLRD